MEVEDDLMFQSSAGRANHLGSGKSTSVAHRGWDDPLSKNGRATQLVDPENVYEHHNEDPPILGAPY